MMDLSWYFELYAVSTTTFSVEFVRDGECLDMKNNIGLL